TYYGIGMSLVRITKAIFDDENSVLTVSVLTTGQYGINGVYLGLPAIINRNGVRSILNLRLSEEEVTKLQQSAATLAEFYAKLRIK
ncbi:MAG: L-lactate dehydrogenase, partial [Firmicutes bacterium]|nr:L-lactate dehydrogenase [Bacillota bacterium]